MFCIDGSLTPETTVSRDCLKQLKFHQYEVSLRTDREKALVLTMYIFDVSNHKYNCVHVYNIVQNWLVECE